MYDKTYASIYESYSEADKDFLLHAMQIASFIGLPCPIQTEEDFRNWCNDTLHARDEAERKEAEKKARAIAKEDAEAKAQGITVEELRDIKKKAKKLRRYKSELQTKQIELKRIEKAISWRKEEIAKLEKELDFYPKV